MQTLPGKRIALLSVSLVLSACGGGGGTAPSPSPTPVTTTDFTKWSDGVADKTIKAVGEGSQVSGAVSDGKIVSIVGPEDTTATALFTFDANSNLTQLALTSTSKTSPTSTTAVLFAGGEISALSADADFVKAISGASQALISKPNSSAWDYQSFGVWETPGGAGLLFNTMSLGAPTAGAAIPGNGTANFTGKVIGSYLNADGLGHTVLANLAVTADWGAQSLALTTLGTRTSPDGGSFTNNDNLNLSGTLNYTAGTNGFSGTLTSTSGLTGSSAGQFYGPAAQELGGVFSLKAVNGVETYSGAYGAKLTPP